MNRLHFSNILLLSALLILGCGNRETKQEREISKSSRKNRSLDSVQHWATELSLLSSSTPEFGDLAATLNGKIEDAVKEIRDSSNLSKLTTSLSDINTGISVVESEHKKLVLFSWDTRMGGSMGDYKNIALYQSNKKILGSTLKMNTVFPVSIFTVQEDEQKSIFMVSGLGKSSSFEHFMRLDALTIVEDQLVDSKIFPFEKSSWSTSFSNEEMDSLPPSGFVVDENGKTIQNPFPLESGKAWTSYVFNGTNFMEQVYPLKSELGEQDFMPKNEFGFINGSEIPSALKNQKVIFEDGMVIRERDFQEEEKVEVSVLNLSDTVREIEFTNNTELIGKWKNYLFFDGGGVPENWLCHIYNIEQQRFVFSLYLSKIMFMDKLLVFSKLSEDNEQNTKSKNSCEEGYRRFNLFTFQFKKTYPQIQPTERAYCAYIQ
ncbi:hypothetical protein [Flagellimonas sp.]|uniref:hypothetical protein n=1 Tax=Flagellimonas sp. TaxID=2058762 RepID=UPI003F49FBFC